MNITDTSRRSMIGIAGLLGLLAFSAINGMSVAPKAANATHEVIPTSTELHAVSIVSLDLYTDNCDPRAGHDIPITFMMYARKWSSEHQDAINIAKAQYEELALQNISLFCSKMKPVIAKLIYGQIPVR